MHQLFFYLIFFSIVEVEDSKPVQDAEMKEAEGAVDAAPIDDATSNATEGPSKKKKRNRKKKTAKPDDEDVEMAGDD